MSAVNAACWPLRRLAWVLVMVAPFAGCGGGFVRVESAAPLDRKGLSALVPGVTSFSTVVSEFGPPHAIVDGVKDLATPPAGPLTPQTKALPSRVVHAPDGMVILVYFGDLSASGGFLTVATVAGSRSEIAANEVFIYLSKTTLKVVEVVVPPARR
jgi:hypothetical protein